MGWAFRTPGLRRRSPYLAFSRILRAPRPTSGRCGGRTRRARRDRRARRADHKSSAIPQKPLGRASPSRRVPPRAEAPSYYIDHDGRVFLVHDAGLLRLPCREEVPFAFAEKHRARVLGREVVFGSPLDKHHREDWRWKDELPALAEADPLARMAANLSQTRVVAKLALRRGRDVLLIKDKVGFYAGKWSLPGGYLDYGETPEACAAREAMEEVGLKVEVTRLLRVDSQMVPTGYHFLTFHYEGRAATEAVRLKADEIEDARWFALTDAVDAIASPHSRLALEALLREERRA